MAQNNTFGIISIIFGILAFIFFPLVFGLLAIIFGLIGMSQDRDKTLATIGLIIGIIVLVLLFIGVIRWAVWRIIK